MGLIQITTISADGTIIAGRAFGHGVGLCQYGAGGLASRGEPYRSILGRYFPGSTIRRLYD